MAQATGTIEVTEDKVLRRRYFTRVSANKNWKGKQYLRIMIPSDVAAQLGIRKGDVLEWQVMADLLIVRVSRHCSRR